MNFTNKLLTNDPLTLFLGTTIFKQLLMLVYYNNKDFLLSTWSSSAGKGGRVDVPGVGLAGGEITQQLSLAGEVKGT